MVAFDYTEIKWNFYKKARYLHKKHKRPPEKKTKPCAEYTLASGGGGGVIQKTDRAHAYSTMTAKILQKKKSILSLRCNKVVKEKRRRKTFKKNWFLCICCKWIADWKSYNNNYLKEKTKRSKWTHKHIHINTYIRTSSKNYCYYLE